MTDVNSEVATLISSIVTDFASGNERVSIIGGINANHLKICSADPNTPEIVIYSPSSMTSLPL